mgnify:CR=1 FL=1
MRGGTNSEDQLNGRTLRNVDREGNNVNVFMVMISYKKRTST